MGLGIGVEPWMSRSRWADCSESDGLGNGPNGRVRDQESRLGLGLEHLGLGHCKSVTFNFDK